MGPLLAYLLVYHFVPMSEYSRNRYIGVFINTNRPSDALNTMQRKYNIIESGLDPISEAKKLEKRYNPFRGFIDHYIKKFGSVIIGPDKAVDHEKILVKKLENEGKYEPKTSAD